MGNVGLNTKISLNKIKRELEKVFIPVETRRVKEFLRKIGEPTTLFGERDHERKVRLDHLMASYKLHRITQQKELEKKAFNTEIFFTEACPEVKNIRIWLAKFSLVRAYSRMCGLSPRNNNSGANIKNFESISCNPNHVTNSLSEIADDRPITSCAFTIGGKHLLTASVSGNLKVWSIPIFKK